MPAKKKPFSHVRALSLAAAAAALALAGCGGGGGGDDAEEPPAPTLIRENYALVTTSPAATYASGSAAAHYYEKLNAMRVGMGAGALTQNAALDTAAAAHLAYLVANYPDIGSTESAGQEGFTAVTPTERAFKAGYASTKVSEFLGTTTGPTATVDDCVQALLENPYALNALAEPWRDVGIAYGVLKAAPPAPPASGASDAATTLDPTLPAAACVLVLGIKQGANGQLPDAGFLKAYPYAGQQDVTIDFGPGPQGQQPAPDLQNKSGFPLQVSMADFGSLSQSSFSVERFVLRDPLGREVPSRLIVNRATGVGLDQVYYRDPMYLLPPSDVMLLPLSPLALDTTYTAQFKGANGAVRYDKTWSFTTRPASLPTSAP